MGDDDGEQLLLEALQAKAGQASLPTPEVTAPREPAPSHDDADTGTLTFGWLLLVVALLGLATGAVIGFLTVV